jgi:hypothetical protein
MPWRWPDAASAGMGGPLSAMGVGRANYLERAGKKGTAGGAESTPACHNQVLQLITSPSSQQTSLPWRRESWLLMNHIMAMRFAELVVYPRSLKTEFKTLSDDG